MKYIVFWEFEAKDFEKSVQKYANLPEGMELKSLSENYVVLGETRGFQLLETDNPVDIAKLALYYAPETDFTVQPIIEAKQVMDTFEQLKT
ncbi:hypothetical protein CEE45_15955 [Candidatus Heimdallarchaeota archaeon B3_Heim]|nr:MAG: hypothetical protein CEE45_15955 [Candidatus Heimdallarchaeota archaeon B3_Heim]